MSAFIRYQLISFVRSLKFIPPVVIFFVWVFILYAYKNVPILSSYAASSIAMYLIMTWITMAIFTMDEESEKHILISHLKRKVSYLFGKWLTILVVMIPLLLFAIFFPIITESFKGNMSIKLYAYAFYSHLVFMSFGILVGTLFSATKISTKKYAWLSSVLIIVVSLASKSIIEISLFFKWILWVFPPVFKVIGFMEGEDQVLINIPLIIDSVFVVIYLIIGAVMLVSLFIKKER
ncbi:ABC transporter permease [Solibacillus sp. MA9]|uniref:ABC transporter permease n=1 Tax=Solibacillus palustris TaxID=2908203 RepID=A0ABS9UFY5_9BACL|nr:ABC transporter permease [Solibacillus sp. MA9]MCH7323281.1 ABC transporter permease [Solibacillus sp. MA9]